MNVINDFWNWIVDAVYYALNVLNTMYNNTTMRPFFYLLIVVFSTMVIFKFIVSPLIGGIGSDTVSKESKEDAELREWERSQRIERMRKAKGK